MTTPTLTTERLSIEPMTLAHWEDYASAWADPRMTAFICGEPRRPHTNGQKIVQGFGKWSLLWYGYCLVA